MPSYAWWLWIYITMIPTKIKEARKKSLVEPVAASQQWIESGFGLLAVIQLFFISIEGNSISKTTAKVLVNSTYILFPCQNSRPTQGLLRYLLQLQKRYLVYFLSSTLRFVKSRGASCLVLTALTSKQHPPQSKNALLFLLKLLKWKRSEWGRQLICFNIAV